MCYGCLQNMNESFNRWIKYTWHTTCVKELETRKSQDSNVQKILNRLNQLNMLCLRKIQILKCTLILFLFILSYFLKYHFFLLFFITYIYVTVQVVFWYLTGTYWLSVLTISISFVKQNWSIISEFSKN